MQSYLQVMNDMSFNFKCIYSELKTTCPDLSLLFTFQLTMRMAARVSCGFVKKCTHHKEKHSAYAQPVEKNNITKTISSFLPQPPEPLNFNGLVHFD